MAEATPDEIAVAVSGNPNAGKTTIFNNLTGAHQYVGNWSGVTVEKKEGSARYDGHRFQVVDLPGTYSLTAYSLEEVVVRDYISGEKPDVVLDVVDASNIDRNLYLTTQLMELGAPVIIALNMMDVAESRGMSIDIEMLSRLLGMPVIPTVGQHNRGTDEIKEAVVKAARGELEFRDVEVDYGYEIEDEIAKIRKVIERNESISRDFLGRYSSRWLAIKLLEQDDKVEEDLLGFASPDSDIFSQVTESLDHLTKVLGGDVETAIVDSRYGFASGVVHEAVKRPAVDAVTFSDRVDRVLANRILGFPFFAFFMWLMFYLTFAVGKYPMGWIDRLFIWLTNLINTNIASPAWLNSLLTDGVVHGVGAVLVFLPQIFIIFLCISILEDTGYMARAAFIMDRIMRWLGLQGKSFIPMLMGFGCNVPAIMATRTLASGKDRMITILVTPLMSCTARLPIYALFTAAFFSAQQGAITLSLYLLGIILAVAMAKLFRKVLFPGEGEPFVMELPPYRVPTLKGTMIHMWNRGSLFLRKAGTIILAGSVVIWVLAYFPSGVEYGSGASIAGHIGKFIEPLVKPLGLDWMAAVALLFGLLAKEIVVSTFGTLLGTSAHGASMSTRLRSVFTPLTAYVFMAFCLIYTPCLATIAVIKRETNSWKWTAFAVGYAIALAWVVAFLIYRVGLLFGLG